ncbi:ecdysone-induced protein 78C-like [Mercenaria mercenaria]|uniref:ecdysone-induced protein 78C-like n=1 Tax=Mercenaria mercenaria TaxID=6596 RepID=UPI00234EFED4|nr:ecdysone-induced protein 78C-like [Mercenaria mercenaria]
MANIPESSNTFAGNIQNVPDFVQKLTADSITPGRMSLLNDSYGSMTGVGGSVTNDLSMASGSGMLIPVSVVPTPVLDTVKIKTEPIFTDDVKPKIKVEESSIQPADSNSPKQPFVPCKVCGDRASGYHYGVTSCEGCKVSVRFGRVPKRSKSMDEQHVSSTEPTLEQTALESKQLAIYDIILNVSQAHLANCGVTDDKLKLLQRRHATLMTKIEIPDTLVQFSDEELETQRLLMWQCYANLTTPAIQSMVEFVKRIPGILELSQDDQLILIKMSFFEMWITRMARMFSPEDNVLTFEDGSMIQKEELSVVYTAEFVNAMFDVAGNINGLNLNDTEIGLLTAVILATPDRHGIRDMKAVENLWEKLIEALKLQLKRNHSTEENLFGTALVKLSELRTLGSHHNELLQYYRSHWHRCKIPPLFSEIYDIPKNDFPVYSTETAPSS